MEEESRLEDTRGWGQEEDGELAIRGYRVSLG